MKEQEITGEQFKKILDSVLDEDLESILVKSFGGDKCQSKK